MSLIFAQLGRAAFQFFQQSWMELPSDRSRRWVSTPNCSKKLRVIIASIRSSSEPSVMFRRVQHCSSLERLVSRFFVQCSRTIASVCGVIRPHRSQFVAQHMRCPVLRHASADQNRSAFSESPPMTLARHRSFLALSGFRPSDQRQQNAFAKRS